jgi:hypothetical protein
MRDRRKLAAMRRIAEVERMRRSAAEEALLRARRQEMDARDEADLARQKAEEAHDDWYRHVTGSSFLPEHCRIFGSVAVDLHHGAATAEAAADRAATQSAADELAWRTIDARLRRSEASMRDVRRALARRIDEIRLSALEDRITLKAMRR